jgi:hypothetical protein
MRTMVTKSLPQTGEGATSQLSWTPGRVQSTSAHADEATGGDPLRPHSYSSYLPT